MSPGTQAFDFRPPSGLEARIADLERQLAEAKATIESLKSEPAYTNQIAGRSDQAPVAAPWDAFKSSNGNPVLAELRLEAVMEAIPAAVLIADPKGQIVAKNHWVDQIWGGDAPLASGIEEYARYRGWWPHNGQALNGEDWALARAVSKRETIAGEWVDILRFDGTCGTILCSASPILDDDGKQVGAILIAEDTTPQRKLEHQALQAAEEAAKATEAARHLLAELSVQQVFFHAVLDQLPVGISIAEAPSGRVLYHNREAERLLGHPIISGEDYTVYSRYHAVHADGTPYAPEAYPIGRAILYDEVTREEEMRYQRSDGSQTIFSVSSTPVSDENGNRIAAVSTYYDISERKRLEEALFRSQSLLAQAEQMAHLGAWEIEIATPEDLSANPLYWSDEVYRIFGYEPGSIQVTNELFFSHVHPDDRPLVAQTIALAIAEHKPYQVEHRIRRADGGEGVVLEHAEIFFDKHGRPERIIGAVLDITERKQAEDALRFSEQRFNQAFNASPNAQVISRQEDGLIQIINDAFAQLFDYTREEVRGKTSLELNLFAKPADRQEAIERLRKDKSVRDCEVDIRTKSGEIRRASLSAEMMSVGHEDYLLTVIQDITERKLAEDRLKATLTALQESEERFATMFHESPVALALVSASDYRALDVNRVFEQLYGYTREEVIGKTSLEVGLLTDPAKREEIVDRIGRGESLTELELRIRRKDGVERIVSITYRSIDIRGSRCFMSTSQDITERKLWEEQLRATNDALRVSEQEFRAFFELANAGKVEYDPHKKRFLRVNQKFCEICGYSKEELLQMSISDLTHPDDRQTDTIIYEAAFGENADSYEREKRYVRKDGAVVWVQVSGSIVYAESGYPLRTYAVVQDITERKRLEGELADYAHKLEESNQELQNFAFIASHDLQEPLRKIKRFGEMLYQKTTGKLDDSEREYLERMMSSVERMQAMIEGLLELSRISTHGKPFSDVNLKAITDEVVSDLEVMIRRTGGVVTVKDLPTIQADPLQMRQLIQNLIGNALKFHRPGVPPTVKVSSMNKSPVVVKITVEDNGIGFDENQIGRIFQPFQRLVTRSQYEGTGMGLATCKKIVERHGGEITAQSTPGQGSRFIVTLPRQIGR